jgi:hypothetical protein
VWNRIEARHSGQVLDVIGGSFKIGTNVGMWDQLKGPAKQQKWTLKSVPDHSGHYWLAASHSGALLDLPPGQAANQGAEVFAWENEPTGKANQHWKLEYVEKVYDETTNTQSGEKESVEKHYFRIKNAHSGLYLDVLGAGGGNGTTVGQWSQHTGYWQQWSFNRVTPVSPDKVLIQGEIITTPKWVQRCGPGGTCSVTIGESYTFSSGLVDAWSSEFETTLSRTLSSSLKVGVKSESPIGSATAEAEVTAEISEAFRDAFTRSKSKSSEQQNESKSSLTCEFILPTGKLGYFYESVSTLGKEKVTQKTCIRACGTTKPTFDVGSEDHLESCN